MGCIASRNELRFKSLFGWIFFDFRWILGPFWEAKASPKFIFRKVFGDAFFERVLASILDGCLEARNMNNSNFPREKRQFSQNRRFQKKFEKSSILGQFLEKKLVKIQ